MDDTVVRNSILVVDDEKANLIALNHLLNEEYDIFMAKDGQTALEKVQECMPDLVLLDIIMPDIDGYEVLSKIRRLDGKIRDVRVIFITGLSGDDNEAKGLTLGAADYINKPFNSTIVKLRVHNQLQIVNQMRIIERLSEVDQLTGIPNRRSLDNQMFIEWGRSVRRSAPLAFLMMDVDKFKVFNDTYGHIMGDVVLQTVAKTFARVLKRPADFAARYGGEEFCVMLPDTAIEGAMKIAEEIRRTIEETSVPYANGEPLKVTISIGVHSQAPTLNDDISTFIAKADAALYRAKEEGRNRVCRSLEE
jgi:diguanylate cyclase (GGDEF)-like protein